MTPPDIHEIIQPPGADPSWETTVYDHKQVGEILREWFDRQRPDLAGTGAVVSFQWRARPAHIGPNAIVALHVTIIPAPQMPDTPESAGASMSVRLPRAAQNRRPRC